MKKQADPRMHTAEHILNQTMIQIVGTKRCFSAHIEKKKSKCDYHFDRDLGEMEVKAIEEKINSIIQKDLPVTEEFITIEEAREKFDLNRLPSEEIKEIRIIKVGDYDACPCIGEHVQSTKELIGFRIVSHSFENGVLRIRYKLLKK